MLSSIIVVKYSKYLFFNYIGQNIRKPSALIFGAYLQYAVWWGKNTTNSDWIKHYGNAYRYVNGTRSESTTPGSTSIKFSLGDEPYDDGKWSILLEPFYSRYYYRVTEITHTDINWETKEEYQWTEPKTEWLEVKDHAHDPVYYE
ncbi:MAG: hypothetical protein IKK95_05115, partial [Lachnospiraceae bacterium]|nr:hypothetical protein [Lachnospiraceae bacterium]